MSFLQSGGEFFGREPYVFFAACLEAYGIFKIFLYKTTELIYNKDVKGFH